MKRRFLVLLLVAAVCQVRAQNNATTATAESNQEWYSRLDFTDRSELANARRGLIEATPDLVITNASGQELWNMQAYRFLLDEGRAPATVNPSLWQNALCNVQCGLFKVCDGIYQVRGYDISNMTFIKTRNGWIIFDVLMSCETAQAALNLFKRHIDANPRIVAVLISHSHADHYGGVGAIVNPQNMADARLPLQRQLESGKIPVITPEGFMKQVIAENLYCNAVMKRRARYQYGSTLPKGVTGCMGVGIGMGENPSLDISLLPPTFEIRRDTTVCIDGIDVEFQLTPDTEAPNEMNAYFPQYRALWMAENCTASMHNLYTLRGAQVRDAEAWCNYILEAEHRFADKADVVFQSHNWPHWGRPVIKDYMQNTAAVYKFIHDQTLHYMNQGLTPTEIADTLRLPEKLDKVWYTRQYYGTLSHNVKAVYQKYMGWYDANPVNLNLLTPQQTAKKWVEYLGDTQRVLEMARQDYAKGQYQWVAQVTKELVYADPANTQARQLCADALEQLGYQSESGTWRNCYLTAAKELRQATFTQRVYGNGMGLANMLKAATLDMIFEYAAIYADYRAVENYDVTVNFIIGNEQCAVVRRHGVLLVYKHQTLNQADATVRDTKAALVNYITGTASDLTISGSQKAVKSLFEGNKKPWLNFNIIEP